MKNDIYGCDLACFQSPSIEPYQALTGDQGHREIVRHGYLPERRITTGIG